MIPNKFLDEPSLTSFLLERSSNLPYVAGTYLPIIKAHAKKYPLFSDFDEWQSIPFFEFLAHEDTMRLIMLEKELEQIHKNIGEAAFKQLQDDLTRDSLQPTIHGCHNKLLDFYCEILALNHFIEQGYNVTRIPRQKNSKSADFYARSEYQVLVVECKFKHTSNHFESFIKRYTRYLSGFSKDYLLHKIQFSDSISYPNLMPEALKQEQINKLKIFIHTIFLKKLNMHEIILDYNVKNDKGEKEPYKGKILYQRKNKLDPVLVPIENQVNCLNKPIENFFDTLLVDLIEKKVIPQINHTRIGNETGCGFICLQFDSEYRAPYDEMDQLKQKIQDDFAQRYSARLIIIFKDVGSFN